MAFCKYCGKPLNEGEVCGCAGNAAAQQAANAQQMNGESAPNQMNPNQQMGGQFNTAQMQQKANEYMQQGMEAAGNAWKNLLGIFKAPAQQGRQYVAKADMTVSLILIALQAIIAGLFGLFCILKTNAAFSGFTSLLSYSSKNYKLSVVKGFFITLLFSAIFSMLFALIFFVAGKIVKAEIDFKKALAITSIRSTAVIPFMLVGCILLFVSAPAGMFVFYLGNVLAICFVYAAMTGICEENKLSYMVAAAMLVFFIIAVLVMGKAFMLYMPSGLKGFGNMKSLMNMFF